MTKAQEIEEKWTKGCENDTLDSGDLFGDLLKYTYELESAVEQSITGLEWDRDNGSPSYTKSDEEHLAKMKKLLNDE